MNPIDLIVTVCAVLSPMTCEDIHLVFSGGGSLRQCVMGAPPYIAQWIGEPLSKTGEICRGRATVPASNVHLNILHVRTHTT